MWDPAHLKSDFAGPRGSFKYSNKPCMRRDWKYIFSCARGRTWAWQYSETRSYNLCSGGPREIYRCQREIGCKFNWPSHSSRDLWRGLSVYVDRCAQRFFDCSHSLSLYGNGLMDRKIFCRYIHAAIAKCFSQWRWAISLQAKLLVIEWLFLSPWRFVFCWRVFLHKMLYSTNGSIQQLWRQIIRRLYCVKF